MVTYDRERNTIIVGGVDLMEENPERYAEILDGAEIKLSCDHEWNLARMETIYVPDDVIDILTCQKCGLTIVV